MSMNQTKRVIIKLSGEALGPAGGVDAVATETICRELKTLVDAGVSVGIVVGAGNLVRGRQLTGAAHIEPQTADYMGMAATQINALALRDTLTSLGAPAIVMSAFAVPLLCETYFRPDAIAALDAGKVVIFSGGTSHPGVTTDMCAAIRANDINADVVLKATKVDGVYDKDPHKFDDAVKYDTLTLADAIAQKLGVMDLPAMAFCMERSIPVVVFNMNTPGNCLQAAQGQPVGTTVS
jgi:uridylate kinase